MELYVTTYQTYNQGSLAGKWVDLADFGDYDEFLEHIQEFAQNELKDFDAEFFFSDYDGLPKSLYDECNAKLAFLYSQLSDDEQDHIINALAIGETITEKNFDDVLADMENRYICECNDFEQYVREYCDEIHDLDNMGYLASFIDWQRVADSMEGDYQWVNYRLYRA